MQPVSGVRKGRFSAVARLIYLEFRKCKRQIILVKKAYCPVFPVDYREGLTPVTLAAEEPVTQLVIYPVNTEVPVLEPFCNCCNALFDIKPVKTEVKVIAG